MDTKDSIKKWSQLHNTKVRISSAGKTAGTVEDFYFKPESTGVDALLVRTRLGDAYTLPIIKIQQIENNEVVIESEQMLARRPSPYPLGSSLIGNKVEDEEGNALGTISEIFLSVEPIVATRVTGFGLSGKGRNREKTFSSDAIMRYEQNLFTLQDQFARKLK